MGKNNTTSGKAIAEYIFNDYLVDLQDDGMQEIINKLPMLADNNLACSIRGREFLDFTRVSIYRLFSKYITKYNKSLKNHRRTPVPGEFGTDGNVDARNDKRLSDLAKYGLEEGKYFAEVDESEYLAFIVEFDKEDEYAVTYTIWFIGNKWKKNRDKFRNIVEEYREIKNKEKRERINYTNGKPSTTAIFKPFDKVVFAEKDKILRYIDNFINNIPEYYKYGMTPKLSIMIYGKPGTGKSTFAKALANYMNISSVTSVSPDYFSQGIQNDEGRRRIGVNGGRAEYGKTIYVLDDIDCICKSREEDSSQENSKVVSNLLAFLDNPPTMEYTANDKVNYPISVVVATTNYYDKLDEAVKRFGRFDLTIEMKEFNKKEAEEMCSIYNLTLKDVLPKEEYNMKGFVISPSKLQALCLENIDKSLKNGK